MDSPANFKNLVKVNYRRGIHKLKNICEEGRYLVEIAVRFSNIDFVHVLFTD